MSGQKPFNLSDFTVKKLLKNNDKKLAVLCLSSKSKKFSILELAKTPDFKMTYGQICSSISKMVIDVTKNDVYYVGQLNDDKTIKCRFICPAKDSLVRIYEDETLVDCYEWPRDFNNYTKKHIADAPSSKWIHNILDKSADQDLVIYRDDNPKTGFVLMKDMFWNENNAEELYCKAFVMRKDLRCVRDLTAKDIPLLENVLHKAKKVISAKYKIPDDKIFASFQYHPQQFWHLHIEFIYKLNIPHTWYEVHHVISCLKFNTDFYKNGKLAVKCKIRELSKKFEPIAKKDIENIEQIFEINKKKILTELNK